MDEFDLRDWIGFAEAGGDLNTPAMIDQVSIDSRRIWSSHALFVPLPGTQWDGHQFVEHAVQSGAKYVLVKKNWKTAHTFQNCTLLRVEDPLLALQSIAKSYRKKLPTKIVAIAGSHGKTMVKDLLQAILRSGISCTASPESFNSQIGVPLSLFAVRKHHTVAIIEMGISERQEIDRLIDMVEPDYALLTQMGKKHLSSLGSYQALAEELIKLPLSMKQDSWVLMPDHPLLNAMSERIKAHTFHWNRQQADLPHAVVINSDQGIRMPYRVEYPEGNFFHSQATFGYYYFLDLVNMAVKAAWLLGIPAEAISATLSNYTVEPIRTEIWKSPQGITFINDSYCSDPQSVTKALEYFHTALPEARKIFIFGGMEGQDERPQASYKHAGKEIAHRKIDTLILVGSYPYQPLIDQVKSNSPVTQIISTEDYNSAFDRIKLQVNRDDMVLIKGAKKIPFDVLAEAFNDSICNNQCFINLAAVESNIATLRKNAPAKTRFMIMVKALAYGTNDVRMSQFLAKCGVDILGVSYVDEGIALKRGGVKQSVFVLNATPYEAYKVVKWGLEVGVSEKSLIDALAAHASREQKQILVHLHVDTGMRRLGCRPEDAVDLAKYIQSFPSLKLEGIFTHFACADDPSKDDFTRQQVVLFDQAIASLEKEGIQIPWKHAANSGGIIRFHFPQYNMARIGLAVYGLYPSAAVQKVCELRLAISLLSRIVGINECKKGETVSYGCTYTAKRSQERLAILPIGYFDGLHSNYSGKGAVSIRGKRAPMVGRICMDFMMVDITDIPYATIGDPVLIFGEDEHGHYLSPEDLATSGASIVHELITCLGPRIQRIFIHEEATSASER